ncbi:hypothetical protein NXX53_19815 [Bacteroides salyersiae]|nr:hypothetical protein [Bacteroides salyersiae]
MKGIPFAENEVTITLNKGWNWMGYTPNMEMSVNAALCNLMAEEGDIVMAQDQFATYDGASFGRAVFLFLLRVMPIYIIPVR